MVILRWLKRSGIFLKGNQNDHRLRRYYMSKLVKGLTLLFFIVCITGFVAYKSGYWKVNPESQLQGRVVQDSLPKDNPRVKNLDTLPKLDSTLLRQNLIHGSKSMRIIKPEETKSLLDSLLMDTLKIK